MKLLSETLLGSKLVFQCHNCRGKKWIELFMRCPVCKGKGKGIELIPAYRLYEDFIDRMAEERHCENGEDYEDVVGS